MNKFYILNTMQKSLEKQSGSWSVNVSHSEGQVTRKRTLSHILKTTDGYLVTRTGATHKTFMAALASFIVEYVQALKDLITSMLFGEAEQDISTVFHLSLNGDLTHEGSEARAD